MLKNHDNNIFKNKKKYLFKYINFCGHFTDRYFNSVVHQTEGMDRMDTSESQHIQSSNPGDQNSPNSADGQDNINNKPQT